MINSLHDSTYQNPRNYGSTVDIGSCRIDIINSSLDIYLVPRASKKTSPGAFPHRHGRELRRGVSADHPGGRRACEWRLEEPKMAKR